ncbi:8-oxo-dGTP diphosphatase [Rossellomorea vietnamensis]|uniref:8-oxo-dGTP diphosphatase n=1 Tax=Rossellomorea vietnamensis TaxID=218284 RepID=A0A5D4MB29_9BACI|nr:MULTISPECIES: 8-oxo-dGTP diphosphatase [Bacillaceae]TYR99159.1 8-oxo-dGTP diphosphatase [Rossellomorea vietnamensis]
MQRVTNCLYLKEDKVLLLQKPRRNWWVAPGGKMEQGESIRDAVIREYREETGIYLRNADVKGIFTFIIKEGDKIVSEWMMFSFFATEADGVNLTECEEGILEWHDLEEIKNLPMAEGDRHILEYMVHGKGTIYGTFTYTPDFKLLAYKLDPS